MTARIQEWDSLNSLHTHIMYTSCATILATNSNRDSNWCYTKFAVNIKKKNNSMAPDDV